MITELFARFKGWLNRSDNEVEERPQSIHDKPFRFRAFIKEAHTSQVNPETGTYTLELTGLSSRAIEEFSKRNIRLRLQERSDLYVRASQPMRFRTHVIGTDKNLTGVQLKEGTECFISAYSFEYEYKGKKGYGLKVLGIYIKEDDE